MDFEGASHLHHAELLLSGGGCALHSGPECMQLDFGGYKPAEDV